MRMDTIKPHPVHPHILLLFFTENHYSLKVATTLSPLAIAVFLDAGQSRVFASTCERKFPLPG